MELLTGTSGFAYDAWTGSFYPEDLPARERLRFYAERLPAVEINQTFYRLPRRSTLEAWAAQVPERFRFAIKASRRITHQKRLREAGDETAYLVDVVSALGPKLGALLFQLPPHLRCDAARLERFLDLLPPGTPAAFEFRHPSWDEPAVRAALRARGLAHVRVDQDDAEAPVLEPGEPFLYLRLRRAGYARPELADWAKRLRASGAPRAFVFLKHEDAGEGPLAAAELRELFQRGLRRKPALARGRRTKPAQRRPA